MIDIQLEVLLGTILLLIGLYVGARHALGRSPFLKTWIEKEGNGFWTVRTVQYKNTVYARQEKISSWYADP